MAMKYTVENDYDSLKITKKWWSTAGIFFVIFSTFWNGIVLVFLFSGAGWFILLHLIIGVFVGWYALATVFNKTVIEANPRELLINHGPIPWPLKKNHRIAARSLVQLYVDRSNVKINNQPTYNLVAKLDTDSTVKLMSSQVDRSMLSDLERAIEAHLDIENDASLGYQEGQADTLDLEQFAEQMEKLEPIMKWLPKGMVKNIKETEMRMKRQQKKGPTFTHLNEPPPYPKPGQKNSPFTKNRPIPAAPRGGKDLYVPDNPINFPLYASAPSSAVRWKGESYTVVRSAQIDFQDPDMPTGIQIELSPQSGGDPRYLYAHEDHQSWNYAEERRLDDTEVAKLGFVESSLSDYPMKLENGDDRYYPRSEQTGTRYRGGSSEAVKQYVYFTVGEATQFRALRVQDGAWEVFVQEVVDGGEFGNLGE